MMMTTTATVEGRPIASYEGIVFGEVVAGINFVKDFAAGFRNFFGGRSTTYEDELVQARQQALEEMGQRAKQIGADAIVGVKVDVEVLGTEGGMLMITCSGTAVKFAN